jgi:hypothetical protein
MLLGISTNLSTHIMPLRGIFNFPSICNANITYKQSPEKEVILGPLNVTLWNSKQKSWSKEKII